MFNKIKNVTPQNNYILYVRFINGVTKKYDVSKLFDQYKIFNCLKEDKNLYNSVTVDTGEYAIVWNDELDISCNELWNNGVTVKTPFDNLLSFTDASTLWNLSESTLRKAVFYGKFENEVDVCKIGHDYLITKEAMIREYGEIPK